MSRDGSGINLLRGPVIVDLNVRANPKIISERDHQIHLADGGLGFLLGDGALRYGREDIVEAYYTAHVWRGIYVAPDLQHINNPGYNQDRGPVPVGSFRLHVEF